MKKSEALLYSVIFAAAFVCGALLNSPGGRMCNFEPYAVTEAAEQIKMVKKGGVVNINTASAGELTALSGIGEKLAQRIVKYRDENGGFEVKEDILKVPGIGEKKFAGMRDYIKLD